MRLTKEQKIVLVRMIRNYMVKTTIPYLLIGFVLCLGAAGASDCGTDTPVTWITLGIGALLMSFSGLHMWLLS